MTAWREYIQARLAEARRAADEDIVLEWTQHADAACAAVRAEGASVEEADAHVRRLVDAWCAECDAAPRRTKHPPAVEPPPATGRRWSGVAQDVRYGVRRLLRDPGFTSIATLLIAIGVGATTTLSSLAYAVLLKPLPWPDAGRLVSLAEHRAGETHPLPNAITNGTYLAWADAPQTVDAIAAWDTTTSTLAVRGQAERVRLATATASLFAVAPTRPVAGRLFTPADAAEGAAVMVMAEPLARRLFVTATAAVGQIVLRDGVSCEIVGVVDPRMAFPGGDVTAWIPMSVPRVVSEDGTRASFSVLRGVARLKQGVTAAQASEEATARAQSAPEVGLAGSVVFGTKNKPTVTATPYLDSLTADVRPALSVIIVAVGLLFVVAVANVAGMQLARMTGRRREVAIRSALGAGPGRLARQLLIENLVLGAIGGLAGWLLSVGLHRTLPRLLPPSVPRLEGFHADWRVLVFAIVCAVGSSVVFGIVPALIARRQNLVEALVEDSQAPAGGGARTRVGRLRVVILAGQVAIAAFLLTGASLFGRSFVALLDADRGYDPRNLATVALPMPSREFTGPRRAEVLDAIVDRLIHTPGVTAAAASSVMPLLPYEQVIAYSLAPGPGRPDPTTVRAEGRLVSPDYFAAMGMRVTRGRGFAASDSRTSRMVAVVNETFVKRYLPVDPIGAELPIKYASNDGANQVVVGIVDDVRQQSATDPPQPEIFFDYRQMKVGMLLDTPVVIARTAGPPAAILPTIARVAREVEPGLVADSSMTMEDRLTNSLALPRLYTVVFVAFAVFALLVAATGLFSVLSYAVAQRTRELGVRAALGARPRDIVSLVVRQALAVSVVGTAVGLTAALALATFIGTLLYGVGVHDVRTVVLVPAAVLALAGVACYGPARRAAAIDPLTALRRTQ